MSLTYNQNCISDSSPLIVNNNCKNYIPTTWRQPSTEEERYIRTAPHDQVESILSNKVT